jgi:Domain of unknown function (DUF1844)
MADEDKPIRVVDRRMFTPEGELRPDFEPEETPEPPKAPPPPSPPPPPSSREGKRAAARAPVDVPAPDEAAAGSELEGGFTGMIRSLATTAYAALGLVPDPAGGRRVDPPVARQMIDWLGVLDLKTRNNLSFEESDLLARVLYELRMAYVEVMRPPSREPR